VAVPEPTSSGRRDLELRNTWQRRSSPLREAEPGAHLSREVRSGAAGHMAALEPTSVGRCGLKLQLIWQRVDACYAPCLDLELLCGSTQSSWCRQRPLGPHLERLRTRRWGQFFGAPLGYLIFLLDSRRRTPGGAGTGGPRAPTINAKKH
jgi:hypothetical protein